MSALSVYRIIRSMGADPSRVVNDYIAALSDLISVAELPLARGADINAKAKDGATPLSDASTLGYSDMVELLRQHGGHR
jgi:ankyrin repeat protein